MVDVPFLLVGFGLGARHATDPDHVAALWNFVTAQQKPWSALRHAVAWGVGHATSFTCVGLLVLLFGIRPAPWFESASQILVGTMLLGLGLHRLFYRHRQSSVTPGRAVSLSTAASTHPIGPRHSQPSAKPLQAAASRRPGSETFFVGLVHGLAGSAAVALLLLTTQTSRSTALGYLLVFGLGSVLGMVAITLTLLLPMSRFAARLDARTGRFSLIPNLLSAGLGALILFDVLRG